MEYKVREIYTPFGRTEDFIIYVYRVKKVLTCLFRVESGTWSDKNEIEWNGNDQLIIKEEFYKDEILNKN